jgi:chemotaxis protein methyltransferase CheR
MIEVDRFRTVIERQLGLHFDNDGDPKLKTVLHRRMTVNQQNCESYLQQIESGKPAELTTLCAELTVSETYFLRHLEQFQALMRSVLPERLAGPAGSEGLDLLSAGCATGEEAYSLAIALRESSAELFRSTGVLGIDVNPGSLAKARSGRYTNWSMRSVPPAVIRRWFTTEDREVVLDPELRERVRFQQCNLSRDDAFFWQPDRFDVIFCRNVLMYFSPEVMAQVVRRLAGSLKPGGCLFLGSAETLRGVSEDFLLRESHGAFFYQLKPLPFAASRAGVAAGRKSEPLPAPSVREVSAPGRPDPSVAALDVAAVVALLRDERFGDALAKIDRIAGALGQQDGGRDPDLLLLRAILLVHVGDTAAAERTARRLTGTSRLRAEAHAVLATCRESEKDLDAAIMHCRTAIAIAAGFAMAHLQLGRLSQRLGEQHTAQREYTESARLLRFETDYRIMLFGGGFDREALISLCRTQSVRIAANR